MTRAAEKNAFLRDGQRFRSGFFTVPKNSSQGSGSINVPNYAEIFFKMAAVVAAQGSKSA